MFGDPGYLLDLARQVMNLVRSNNNYNTIQNSLFSPQVTKHYIWAINDKSNVCIMRAREREKREKRERDRQRERETERGERERESKITLLRVVGRLN